jgi:hypothetical protein
MNLSESSPSSARRSLVQHSLISIVIPLLFVVAASVYLHPVVLNGFFNRPHWTYLVLLTAVSIGQVVSGNALMRERIVGFAPRLRELLLFLIGSYGVLVLVDGSVFRGEWGPVSAAFMYPLVLVVVTWLLGYAIHHALKRREHFLALTEGKSGDTLVRVVRDLSDEAGEADAAVGFVRRIVLVLQVVHLVLLSALLVAESSPRPVWIVLALAYVATSFLITILLNRYLEVNRLIGAGIVPSGAYSSRRNGWLLLVLAVTIAVVVPVSREGAVIPPERIGDALVSLNERLNRRTLEREASGLTVTFDSEERFGPDLLPEIGEGALERSDIIARIARIVGLVIAGALGVGLLFFLIRPLLRRGGGIKLGRRRRFGIRELLVRLRSRIRALLRWIRERPEATARTVRSVVRQIRTAQDARRELRASQAKKRERQREISANPFVREMVRIVRWGTGNGIPYRRSEGVSDYLERIAASYPQGRGEIRTVRSVFERAVYSSHAIANEEQNRYSAAAKSLVRMRGEHG